MAFETMGVLGVLLLLVGLSRCQKSFLDIYVSESVDSGISRSSESNSSHATGEGFSLRTIFDGPVIIIAPSFSSNSFTEARGNLKLAGYYADKGLRTVADYANFQPLHQFLRTTPQMSGLAYPGSNFNNQHLLQSVLEKFIIPDTYRTIDLLRSLRKKNTHVLYVAPTVFFDSQGFFGLKKVAKYLVDEFTIEDLNTERPKLPVKQNPLNSTTQEPPILHSNTIHQQWNRPSSFLIPFFAEPSYVIEQELYRRYRQISPFSFGRVKRS